MPTTPALTITDQAKWQRVLAAFHGSADEYLTWLRAAITAKVQEEEAAALRDQLDTAIATKRAEAKAILDGAT